MRVVILWQYLFGYRIPFYNRLAQTPGIELTVVHGGISGAANAREVPDESSSSLPFRSIKIKTTITKICGAVLYFQTGIWKHLLKGRYDVIVCEGNFGMLSNLPIALYAKLTGTPLFYWTAGWTRGNVKGVVAALRQAFIRLACKLPDGYLCYGSAAKQFLVGFGVEPRRCTITQNTMDSEQIREDYEAYRENAASYRESLGLAGKTIILSVGQLRPAKKMQLLLDAFALVKARRDDLALVVVGDGPEMDRLRAKVSTARLQDVILLGEVFADVGRYFAMSDLFVLPGDGGLAINEAMAWGLPVICSEADGTEKDLVIDGKTGYFFQKDDTEDLAYKIDIIMSSHGAARTMGEAGRHRLYEIASLTKVVEVFAGRIKAHHN